jgi:integrase
MALIRQRGSSWQATIRKKNIPLQIKSFKTKGAARAWVIKTEAAMDNGTWVNKQEQQSLYISDILQRWQDYIHPTIKTFCYSKLGTIKVLQRNLQHVTLDELTPELVMDYGKERRKTIARSTLNTELTYLSQCIDFSRTIFKLPILYNPVREARSVMSQLNMVGSSRHMDRRLREGEYDLLMKVPLTPWMKPIITIATYSAMRQGEIHALYWSDIDFENNTIFIKDRKHPSEKIGNDQIIPMFPPVREAFLRAQNYTDGSGRVFHVKDSGTISDSFRKIRLRAGIFDLRFHDLRHEGISLLFEKNWTIPQVAAVSGHRDWSQLKRYTQLKPGELLQAY